MIQNDSTQQSLQELINLQKTEIDQNQQLLNAQKLNSAAATTATTTNNTNNANVSNGPTSYMPPAVSFSSQTQAYQQQFAQQAQGLGSTNSNGYGFLDTMYVNNSRVSNQTRQTMAADYGARLSNATVAGAGALAGTVADLGGNAIAGGMFGAGLLGQVAMGGIAGGLVGGFAQIGVDQMKQSQAYNKYLLRNSDQIINPLNSKNERDISGFSTGERHEASSYLRNLDTTEYMKSDEIANVTQKFTEGGLLKDTKDLGDFKTKMKKLTDTVKEGALILNETYDTIADLMSSMKKSGIADKNFDPLISKSKVVGSMVGMTGAQALQTSLVGATNINSGTENSNDITANRVEDSLLYTNDMYTKLTEKKNSGKINQEELRQFNAITDAGGVAAVAPETVNYQNQMLSANGGLLGKNSINFFDYDKKSQSFNFNSDEFKAFVSSDKNLNKISEDTATKINSLDDAGKQKWMEKSQTYMINNLDSDKMNRFDNKIISATKGMGGEYADMNTEQTLNSLGLADTPQRTIMAGTLDAYKEDGGALRVKSNAYATKEALTAKINAKNPGILGEMSNDWTKFKNKIGDFFQSNISDPMSDTVQSVQDAMYGKKWVHADIENMSNYDYSSAGMKKDKIDAGQTLSSTLSSLNKVSSSGGYVDPDLKSLVESLKKSNELQIASNDHYTKEKVTKFNSSQGLEDVKLGSGTLSDAAKYKLLQDQSDKNNLSETIVAALLKYAQQNGTSNTTGMSGSVLDEASKALNKKVTGAGDSGFSDATSYLGKLTAAYGGNQNLAMSAFFSSQQSVDSSLRNGGVSIDKARSSGDLSSLSDLDYTKYITNKTVLNNVNGVNNNNTWGGDSHNGSSYDVSGDTFKGGPQYNIDYDYKKGAKTNLKDTNGSVDNYSMIHSYAKQFGISPNALGSTIAIESGGLNPKPNTAGATGIMQMLPSTFQDYVGKTATLPDKSTKKITADDISDPYINAWAGTDYYSKQLKSADNNPYLAYLGYNQGPGDEYGNGLAPLITNLRSDLGMKDTDSLAGITPEQILSTIHNGKHYTNGGNVGMYGEGDKALVGFTQDYNQGLITNTKVKETKKAAVTTTSRNVDAANMSATDEQYQRSLENSGILTYKYDPASLMSLDKSVNANKMNTNYTSDTSKLFNEGIPDKDIGKYNYADALKQYNSRISVEESNLSRASNDKQYGENHPILGAFSGAMGESHINSSQKSLATLYAGKFNLEKNFNSNIAKTLGLSQDKDESDTNFNIKIDTGIVGEWDRNQKLMSDYANASDKDKKNTAWGKLTTTERSQAMDWQQSIKDSGKADALNLGSANSEGRDKYYMLDHKENLITPEDKAEYAKTTGKKDASYEDYKKKANDTSWFTDNKDDAEKNHKIYKTSKTSTADLIKSINTQKEAFTDAQLEGGEKLVGDYSQLMTKSGSAFTPDIKEKILSLIQNPGTNSSEQLKGIASNTTDKSAASAITNMAKVMDDKFGKNTDALIGLTKYLSDVQNMAKGLSSTATNASEAIQGMGDDSLKSYMSALDHDATTLKQAVDKGGPEQQNESMTTMKKDFDNTLSALATKDNTDKDSTESKLSEFATKMAGNSDKIDEINKSILTIESKTNKNEDGSTITPEQKTDAFKKLSDDLLSAKDTAADATTTATGAVKDASTAADQFTTAASDLVKGVVNAITILKKGTDAATEAAGIATTVANHAQKNPLYIIPDLFNPPKVK